MEMTREEKQAYSWALKQKYPSVAARFAARYAHALARYIQRQYEEKPMSRDTITIKDLEQLGGAMRKLGPPILEWKRIVKEFATKHKLTDREAIDVAEIARENF